MKEPRCQSCKSIKNLPPKPNSVTKRKDGTISSLHYLCRICNTERFKKYRNTPEGKSRVFTAAYKSAKKYQGKQNARAKVNYAIKTGLITKPDSCTICGDRSKLDGHHNDYKEPLIVEWLCRVCHARLHHPSK